MSDALRLLKAFIDSAGYEIEEMQIIEEKNGIQYPGIDYKVTKKQKIRRPVLSNQNNPEYPVKFDEFWAIYPKRAGSNPKSTAYSAWSNNIGASMDAEKIMMAMLEGANRYRRFCDATGKTNSEFVQLGSTFLGRQLGYLEDWDIPKQTLLPKDDNKLADYANKNGLSGPRVGESMFDYRTRLQNEVRK